MLDLLFTNPLVFVFILLSIVVAIAVHEFAHAKTADYLGDPTPSLQGRLTLNPRAHIDLYGILFLIITGFGWGKPVQFDPFNLKNHRKDAALISIAGPISNIILAIISSLLLRLFYFLDNSTAITIGSIILPWLIVVNLNLAIFNLLPIHPLDGFKIVEGLLSESRAKEWRKLQRYGFILLILLVVPFGGKSMLSSVLSPILSFLYSIFLPSALSGFI